MFDPGVPEELAGVAEAGFAIERRGMRLRVQVRVCEAAPARFVDERPQQGRTDATAARFRPHGHASDLYRRRIARVKAARAERQRVRPSARSDGQRVDGGTIDAIVFVDLFARRNPLLRNKDRRPNGECRAHANGVADVEKLDGHAWRYDSMSCIIAGV